MGDGQKQLLVDRVVEVPSTMELQLKQVLQNEDKGNQTEKEEKEAHKNENKMPEIKKQSVCHWQNSRSLSQGLDMDAQLKVRRYKILERWWVLWII